MMQGRPGTVDNIWLWCCQPNESLFTIYILIMKIPEVKFCYNSKIVIWRDENKFCLPNVIHCPEESESNFKLGITFGSLKKA